MDRYSAATTSATESIATTTVCAIHRWPLDIQWLCTPLLVSVGRLVWQWQLIRLITVVMMVDHGDFLAAPAEV